MQRTGTFPALLHEETGDDAAAAGQGALFLEGERGHLRADGVADEVRIEDQLRNDAHFAVSRRLELEEPSGIAINAPEVDGARLGGEHPVSCGFFVQKQPHRQLAIKVKRREERRKGNLAFEQKAFQHRLGVVLDIAVTRLGGAVEDKAPGCASNRGRKSRPVAFADAGESGEHVAEAVDTIQEAVVVRVAEGVFRVGGRDVPGDFDALDAAPEMECEGPSFEGSAVRLHVALHRRVVEVDLQEPTGAGEMDAVLLRQTNSTFGSRIHAVGAPQVFRPLLVIQTYLFVHAFPPVPVFTRTVADLFSRQPARLACPFATMGNRGENGKRYRRQGIR